MSKNINDNNQENNKNENTKVTPLEKDDMIYQVQQLFLSELKGESGYKSLNDEEKNKLTTLFEHLQGFRFESINHYKEILKQFLFSFSDISAYVDPVVDRITKKISDEKLLNKGVLVIYTGGTVGSAPKDINDPDSPQIVKSWAELKRSTPGLDRIGFRVDAISFEEPLDSCNVWQKHWIKMAEIIYDYYKDYEGFVILHGTDTMIYTASALSFILQELRKPIIITGSQVAGIVPLRNDAHQNFITSLYIANPKASKIPVVPEVCIFFGNKLIRGCRSKKIDSNGYAAFDSPNYPLLGTAGEQIEIDKTRLRKISQTERPSIFKKLNNTVIMIDVFPGIQHSQVAENLFSDKDLKGVILRSYGTGNIPTDKNFLNRFKEITERDVCVVNVTQCSKGSVEMGLYETSQLLLDRGIISGFDISPEAALVKLMILLGQYGDNINLVKKLMQISLSGEQLYSVLKTYFLNPGEFTKENNRIDIKTSDVETIENYEYIDKAILRFHNVSLTPEDGKDHATIQLFINMRGDASPTEDSENYIGTFKKASVCSENNESLAFDITSSREKLIKEKTTSKMIVGSNILSFTIIKSDKSVFEWDKVELELYITD